jgi:hypothetical protein
MTDVSGAGISPNGYHILYLETRIVDIFKLSSPLARSHRLHGLHPITAKAETHPSPPIRAIWVTNNRPMFTINSQSHPLPHRCLPPGTSLYDYPTWVPASANTEPRHHDVIRTRTYLTMHAIYGVDQLQSRCSHTTCASKGLSRGEATKGTVLTIWAV